MTWDEFATLLAGIQPETPLGCVVQIRSENDREKLKRFTPEQKRIRNEWRSRAMKHAVPADAGQAVKQFQDMIKQAFGGGERRGKR